MSAPAMAPGWLKALGPEFEKPYMKEILASLTPDIQSGKLNPPPGQVFRVFRELDLPAVKVVILGQDPYPNPEDACGLAFSTKPGRTVPASLRRIFMEVHRDLGDGTVLPPWEKVSGDLTHWVQQGVLLLNTDLTTVAGESGAHSGKWEMFIEAVFEALKTRSNIIYLLWGRHARGWIGQIEFFDNPIFEAVHPSPMAQGFIGCGHFSKANEYLTRKGFPAIDWRWKEKA